MNTKRMKKRQSSTKIPATNVKDVMVGSRTMISATGTTTARMVNPE